eukprot:1640320-Pyramimonas_sp.AAC.1
MFTTPTINTLSVSRGRPRAPYPRGGPSRLRRSRVVFCYCYKRLHMIGVIYGLAEHPPLLSPLGAIVTLGDDDTGTRPVRPRTADGALGRVALASGSAEYDQM